MENFGRELVKVLAEEEKSELNKLAANLLRVLAVYHGVCWRTELPKDLTKFYRFAGRPDLMNLGLLDEAIGYLESKGLVSVEYRRRGELLSKETYVDKLVKLRDVEEARRLLQRDEAFNKYRFERTKAIRETLERRRANVEG